MSEYITFEWGLSTCAECLTSLLFISIFLVCIFSVFIIILVEINVKGFLWKCAKKTSIYGQNHKVANFVKDIGHF